MWRPLRSLLRGVARADLYRRNRTGERRPLVARAGRRCTATSGHLSLSLGLSRSLSVLRRLVPLLLARLRLRQTCYVITVGAQSRKFSVSSRVAATLGSRSTARVFRGLCRLWYTNSEKFMNWVLNFVWTITWSWLLKNPI